MCNLAVIEFFIESIRPEEFIGTRVLEVGSKYVNGSIRPLIERFLCPREYIGVDVEPGRYVDVVLSAERVVEYFGKESFDAVISTELLEHVRNWRAVVDNMKKVLKPNRHIYVTTRSLGFPCHMHPHDFWRYEIEDMKIIFSDFEIRRLRRDCQEPGVFLKATKPPNWIQADLSAVSLYSMILGRRTDRLPSPSEMPISRKLRLSLLAAQSGIRSALVLALNLFRT